MDAKQLKEVADNLFSKKAPLVSLWQEVADNFYPERADFTITRSWGTDFAANLMTSYPALCRRDLGNQFSTMLRPTAKQWFHTRRKYVEKETNVEVKTWLEWFEETQRRAMYDNSALFVQATKQGDHDYAAFGQCVISAEMNKNANGLLHRAWHLRDVCWQENEEGKIGFVARKWKPTAQTLKRTFKNVDQKIIDLNSKTPFEEVEVIHFVVDAEMYDKKTSGHPRFSIWYDFTNDKVMEETPIWGRHYIIPRWQTVSGSQYSYSPATVCALPDARLLQAMTFTLLEAGEKAASPPIVATQGVIRSDMALFAGGVTYVDEEYDERLGEALRPLTQDFRGLQYGMQMNANAQLMLSKAFFLDKLTLPQRAPEMTAYEVGQRVQEYIRGALPLFEPMEMEYNAALCEEDFGLILRNGGFGDPSSWPKELRGAEVDFGFESPLHDAIEEQKGHKFHEAAALIGEAVALDASTARLPKVEVALRDALLGIGVPAKWVNSAAEFAANKAKMEQEANQQTQLANMATAAGAAKDLGQSGMVPQAQAA